MRHKTLQSLHTAQKPWTVSTAAAHDARVTCSRLQAAPASASAAGTAAVLERLKHLEVTSAAPERREAAKARRALLRKVQALAADAGRPAEERLAELLHVFEQQVRRLSC